MTQPAKISTQTPVRVGTSWTNASGKTWTVYEVLPFGRARIRSGFIFGEMYFRDIRRALEKAAGLAA